MARRARVLGPLVAVLAAWTCAAPSHGSGPFLRGAAGWEEAMRLADEGDKPVLVYFYTDWCPYCREFDDQLVAAPEVDTYLREIVAVRINPELGVAEAELARRYGINGFPALYVHPRGALDQLRTVRRTVSGPAGPVLKSPTQFVRELERVAG